MAPEIERITNTFLSNPFRVEVARQATASETIEQSVVMFRPSRRDKAASEKRAVLRALIDAEGERCKNAIIFCNRKSDVDIVAKSLKTYGYDAAPIHGDLEQSQRMRTLDGFRDGTLRFLVASDVAARGLDIPAVSHVFNFDVPSHSEDYVHRIGRTGRAGREGKAVMISGPADEKNLGFIEKLIAREIPRAENPLGSSGAAADDETTGDTAPRGRSRTRKPREEAGKPAEARPAAHTPEPKADTSPREDAARKDQGRGRGGDRRDGGGQKVVGMGDHLPSFIEKSFEERLAG
jgi:ATP-dependent RNA helicase RhlE